MLVKPLLAASGLLLFADCALAQTQTQLSVAECDASPGKYIDMGFMEFDQTMDGGWRVIARKKGCELVAADLIAVYREKALDRAYSLDWHEAQVRAHAGQTDKALELFRRNLAYEKARPVEHRSDSNILKAEATVAFFERDLDKLRAARAELAALPKPPGYDDGIAKFKQRYPDLTPPTWRLNLDILDGFIRCFDMPYSEATECRKDEPGAR